MASWLLKSCTSPNLAMAHCSTDANPDSNFDSFSAIDELRQLTRSSIYSRLLFYYDQGWTDVKHVRCRDFYGFQISGGY
ncbi:hypothetical protein TorRG33x02_240000 [Trema orientale]|uniref:Uncharacterized protein n=1 Tax=Trema orientale TaxID=63057 RepID=A0A2P5DWG2_TREOI|nr:hypothetical protein TorRG33x02_240000 [Trema orientale]